MREINVNEREQSAATFFTLRHAITGEIVMLPVMAYAHKEEDLSHPSTGLSSFFDENEHIQLIPFFTEPPTEPVIGNRLVIRGATYEITKPRAQLSQMGQTKIAGEKPYSVVFLPIPGPLKAGTEVIDLTEKAHFARTEAEMKIMVGVPKETMDIRKLRLKGYSD